MGEHFLKDNIVSPEEVRQAEKHVNNVARAWCKVFNIGESSGNSQPWRCVRNLVGNYVTIPSLQGLRKDHKGDLDGDPNKGPKLRPLAAANRAPNAALGNLVAQVTKAIGNNICERYGREIISTEELKRNIDETNSRIKVTGVQNMTEPKPSKPTEGHPNQL